MKKLITSTIILLPLLLLAIMLVSGAIVSLITHIYVESVEFVENETLVLVMDDEAAPPAEQLEVNVLPLKAENRDLIYTVDDANIVSVDEQGVVTAKFYGETFVTVTSAENKAATAKRKVLVTDTSVHAVELGEYQAEMYTGENQRLTATVLPAEASNKNILWSSSAPEILSVTQSGEVTCNGAAVSADGTVQITATSADAPEISATATIRCCEPLVSITAESTANVITAKQSAQFPAVIPSPANATYIIEYTSSNEAVATVNGSGAISFHRHGPVVITATARDGREHTSAVSVRYDCTYGYYMGALFGAKRAYTFDYDECKAAGGDLGISFVKDPEGAEREVTAVTFAPAGLISYNAETERFTLNNVSDDTPLGRVTVTVHAKKYDQATGEIKAFTDDECIITLTRQTREIAFLAGGKAVGQVAVSSINSTMTVSFSEVAATSGAIIVQASPANHTDKIGYRLEGDPAYAQLSGAQLRFSGDGEATVTAMAESGAWKQLKVKFTVQEGQDKPVSLSEAQPVQRVSLSFGSAENNDKATLNFATPEGYTPKIVSSAPEVVKVEGEKLVSLKGGFAEITVSFEKVAVPAGISLAGTPCDNSSSGEPQEYKVKVYVDKPMDGSDIRFFVGQTEVNSGEEYLTSKESLTLTVTLNAPDGAMEGKELWLGGEKATPRIEGDTYTYTAPVTFAKSANASLTATIKYTTEATDCDPTKTGEVGGSRTFESTKGKIISGLVCKNGEAELKTGEEGNDILFPNLGTQIELRLTVESPVPADFTLTQGAVSLTESAYFTTAIKQEGEAVILTLTASATQPTRGNASSATLNVAGQQFLLNVTVKAPADKMEVQFGGKALEGGKSYATFLSQITFSVLLSRTDGVAPTDTKVNYAFGAAYADVANAGGSYTVALTPDGTEQTLTLTSGEGGASFTLNLRRASIEECAFEYTIVYTNGGGAVTLDPFTADAGEVEVFFPRGLKGFDIKVTLKEELDLLGGFDESDEDYFYV